ncbi:MAG: isochorismatase family protein, partial [Rhizobium sp.]
MNDDLLENYRKAYDNRVGFGKRPALVLVDFVEAYFDPGCPLYAGVEPVLEAALEIRNAARRKNVPTVLTNVVYQSSGVDGGRFFEKAPPLGCFVSGNPMGAWPKGLTPYPDELVVSKQYPSAFFGTSLA